MDTPTSCACPSACAVPLVVHRRRLQVLEMALRPGHLLFGVLTVVCSTAAVLGAMGAAHGDTLAFGAILVGASSSLAVPPADHNALFPPPPLQGLWIGVGHMVGRSHHLSFPLVPVSDCHHADTFSSPPSHCLHHYPFLCPPPPAFLASNPNCSR